MARLVVHKRTHLIPGWATEVWEVLCQQIWSTRSTHDDAAVTCKRCLKKLRPKEAGRG